MIPISNRQEHIDMQINELKGNRYTSCAETAFSSDDDHLNHANFFLCEERNITFKITVHVVLSSYNLPIIAVN